MGQNEAKVYLERACACQAHEVLLGATAEGSGLADQRVVVRQVTQNVVERDVLRVGDLAEGKVSMK